MQAFNVNALSYASEPQKQVQPKKTSADNSPSTFRDMLKSVSKRDQQKKEIARTKSEANPKNNIQENDFSSMNQPVVFQSREDFSECAFSQEKIRLPEEETGVVAGSDEIPATENEVLRAYDAASFWQVGEKQSFEGSVAEDSALETDLSFGMNESVSSGLGPVLSDELMSEMSASVVGQIAAGEAVTEDPVFEETVLSSAANATPVKKDVPSDDGFVSASEVEVVPAMQDFSGNIQNPVAKEEEKKPGFFKLEAVDSSDNRIELSSALEDVFSVQDERSFEEKVADFKELTQMGEENDEASLNLTLSLNESASQNILASNDQSAAAAGSTFQEMLTQQIQTNVPDFVKAGSIVLKDGKNGTINMNLKPEALGNVKISLQLSDKVITGQITVHSKEAYEAFRQNIQNLKVAFQNSGFENAELNLNLADTSSFAFAQSESQDRGEQFLSNKAYRNFAVSSDDSGDFAAAASVYENGSNSQINVVA